MKGEILLGGLAITAITLLEYVALQHGIDGVALSAAVGAIAAVVSSITTKRWYQRHGKK
jgi:hypothetical protein